MSKKAKHLKSPKMQMDKKFGTNVSPVEKSVGNKDVKKTVSKVKGKKKFNAGAFARAKKSVYKL